jgi:hypothetical protein
MLKFQELGGGGREGFLMGAISYTHRLFVFGATAPSGPKPSNLRGF